MGPTMCISKVPVQTHRWDPRFSGIGRLSWWRLTGTVRWKRSYCITGPACQRNAWPTNFGRSVGPTGGEEKGRKEKGEGRGGKEEGRE